MVPCPLKSPCSAAVNSNGTVITWGAINLGGDSSAVASALSSGISYVAGNQAARAAVTTAGAIAAVWGDPSQGGSMSPSVASQLSSGVKSVTCNDGACCALKADTSVVCWGDSNAGGTGAIPSGVTSVTAASMAFCALTTGGAVQCWGQADHGGTVPASLATSLSSNVVSMCGGPYVMVALRSDGAAFTWGTYGSGTFLSSSKAALISSGVAQIYCSHYFAAAIKTDGSIVAWGECASSVGGCPGTDIRLLRVTLPFHHITTCQGCPPMAVSPLPLTRCWHAAATLRSSAAEVRQDEGRKRTLWAREARLQQPRRSGDRIRGRSSCRCCCLSSYSICLMVLQCRCCCGAAV